MYYFEVEICDVSPCSKKDRDIYLPETCVIRYDVTQYVCEGRQSWVSSANELKCR